MVEDGKTDEEAVSEIGSTDEIVKKILLEQPLSKIVKDRADTGNKATNLLIAILGFPLWFPLTLAFFAIVIAIYIVIWSVVVVLYATMAAMGVSCIALLLTFILAIISGIGTPSLIILSVTLITGSLAVLFFFAGYYVSKGILIASKSIWKGIKRMLIKKEKSLWVRKK